MFGSGEQVKIKVKTFRFQLCILGVVSSLMMAGCGGGGGGSASTPAPRSSVTISGSLTFDFVPHLQTSPFGLDYDNISQRPIRGAVVEAVNASGTVLDNTISNNSGQYSLSVNSNTDVRVQVKAQILQTTGAQWDVSVTDNTNGNALYVLAGELTNSGTNNSTRDLNADSGWGGSSYTRARSAAPFAILSPIYDTMNKFAEVDPDINFPAVEFRWSVNNVTIDGDLTRGEILTSKYNGQAIFILGQENVDTDEYDSHIIIHEWGHYFEDKISRTDTIGGGHSLRDFLDMRVAFSEGFANALSGIITDDPFYRDSFGSAQRSAFFLNVENNNNINSGWYNEGSVQSIIYDLYDSDDDGADVISQGLQPIYDTLVDRNYTQNDSLTSIYSFINHYRQNIGNLSLVEADINSLLEAQSIFGEGDNGVNETNSAGISNSLPVYLPMSASGSPYELCSLNDLGSFNKLGNRVFGEVTFTRNGSHTLTMTKTSGAPDRDPDFILSSGGNVLHIAEITENPDDPGPEAESLTADFQVGTLILEAYDFKNIDNISSNNGNSCYEFSIVEN